MSKIIKRQIKKTMPWFLIFSLILSSTMVGVVFNYDFSVVKTEKGFRLAVTAPQAEAQSSATTTVEVRNAPPIIVTGQEPYESPTSSSTSPVNVGGSISFKTTATDAESNDFYMIVCTSAGVTPVNGGAPTCNGGINGTLCVSPATTPGTEATCVEDSLADPLSETLAWYSYVCDGHATQADCSPVSQGNGADDDASPLYVNHAPVLNSVLTSVNNQAPGGTFSFTSTSTDTDVAGSNDNIIVHICRTNSYSTSTGCAAGEELCTNSGVTNGSNQAVLSCNWTDTAPTPDQAYNYYAFIKDWHQMPGGAGQGTQSSYTIINVAPTVSSVTLNNSVNIGLNMKDSAEKEVVVRATLSDNNEATDISSATSSIFLSSVAGGLNCAANDNNCYQITFADCSFSNIVGATLDLTCTTTMAYHAIPTDAGNGNTHAGEHWQGGVTVVDDDNAFGTGASGGIVEVTQLLALEVDEDNIEYDVVKGGQNSGDYHATTTIINYGNTPMDNSVNGTDMTHTTQPVNIIPVNQQKYGLATVNYSILPNTLAIAANNLDINLSRPTSSTNVEDEIYWGIAIPNGTISGNYEGTNTFIATVEDGDASWN